jgi:tetratricopeptide (TPR) repeat protein
MNSPSESDLVHLRAAERWLTLGNYLEADAEIEKITAEFQSHPDLLEIRWQIYANESKWGPCLDIARAITVQDPKRASGWIHLAHSAQRAVGGSAQIAYDILLSAIDKVPEDPTIFYEMARFARQLGHLKEAQQSFEKAFQIDSSTKCKINALDDSEFKKTQESELTMRDGILCPITRMRNNKEKSKEKHPVKSFDKGDIYHQQKVDGWLSRKDCLEADVESTKGTNKFRKDSDLLELRWNIYAKESKWGACLDIALTLATQNPMQASGWIYLAYSARRTDGGTAEIAYDILFSAIDKVPEEPTIFYYLGCYACQLGRLQEARRWLKKAFQKDRSAELKRYAFDEPDLELLRNEISEI